MTWLIPMLMLFPLINGSLVTVSYGIIKTPNGVNCTLTINGTEIKITDGKVPGLHYGLIEYECEHNHGFILSKPECYDCGIYCPQNDRLLHCRQFGLPYALGFVTAITFAVIITIVMHKWGFEKIANSFLLFKTNKQRARENRYKKYFSQYNNPTISEERKLSDTNIKTDNTSNRSPSISKKVYPNVTSIALSTLMLTADRTYACDRTLFMHSNGQICDKFKCQDINSYTFNIAVGKLICFNTPSREMMKFQISNTRNVVTYQELYHTSDFNIELESTSQCKQVGICYKETCHKHFRHPNFSNSTGVHGYDCESEGLGCDFMCWHKYACTWYKWWLNEIGSRAQVYKKVSTVWAFDLIVTYKNIMKSYSFNSDLTENDLDIGKLFSSENMPININNVLMATYHENDYILKDELSFYKIDANDINVLSPGVIGDYQISIDGKQRAYKNNEIQCRTSGCKVICSGPEPTLRVFRSIKHKYTVEEYNVLDDYTVRVMTSIPMTVNLNIGNIEFKNLFVEQAKCRFDVLHTFGCIGCTKYPYVVLQASRIENHGVLPYISNCTFNRRTIGCTMDPIILIPSNKYNKCNIYIPSINESIIIDFKYEFYGELSIPYEIYSHDSSFKGIISSLGSNPNFIDTLTYGMFAFTGLGIISSLITKIVLRLIALKKSKEVATDVEMSAM